MLSLFSQNIVLTPQNHTEVAYVNTKKMDNFCDLFLRKYYVYVNHPLHYIIIIFPALAGHHLLINSD